METYHGQVRSPTDAIILFEACRLGMLPRVQRRLSEKERQLIKSGSVFVWDEREAGMRRWTDGKSWSASRVSGSFLTYREMEGKRGGSGFQQVVSRAGRTPDSTRGSDEDAEMAGEEGPDGYRYKPDGLMKQSFSITTSTGSHLHLISYYARSHPTAQTLNQPSTDPNLRHIRPQKGMYPESTVHEQPTVSAVTRGPMGGAPYAISPHMTGYPRSGATHPQSYGPPGFPYPPSPLSTPPNNYSHLQFAGSVQSMPGYLPPINPSNLPYNQSQLPPVSQGPPPPPTTYERSPLATASSLPPPPPPNYITANGGLPQRRASPQTQATPAPSKAQADPSKIDPRLTSLPPLNNSPKLNGHSSPAHTSTGPFPLRDLPAENGAPNVVSASSIPSIGALVHAPDHQAEITAASQTNGRSSPGTALGEKPNIVPQDIPSGKLNHNQDYQALRKLDAAFSSAK